MSKKSASLAPAKLGKSPERPAGKSAPAGGPSLGANAALWRWSPWLCAALVFGLLVPLGLQAGVWAGNGTDLYSYMVPMRDAVQRLGWLPGWNPGPLGGTPAHAALQLGLLYPPNWLLRPFDAAHALEWSVWAHVAWLAGGGVFLSRQLAPQAPPALHLLGAVLWAGSGPLWGHVWAGHVSWVQALAWLPWSIGLAVATIRAPNAQTTALCALAIALQLLAGHPQVSFLGAVGGAVALLLVIPVPEASAAFGRRPVGWLAVIAAAALALALAAAQLWPTAALAPHLNRALSTPREIALAFETQPQTLLTALAPHAGGGPGTAMTNWGSYHESVSFVGAGGAGLAALGALGLGAGGAAALVWVGFCAVLAAGSHGGLLPLLADTVPGFGAFRVPSRWMLAAWPVLAVLLSVGLHAQLRGQTVRKPGAVVAGLFALVLLVLGLGWSAEQPLLATGLVKDVAPAVLAESLLQTRMALLTGAGAMLVAAAVGVWPHAGRLASWSLAAVAVAQALWFVRLHVPAPPARVLPAEAFHWSDATAAALRKASADGQQRIATAAPLRHANRPGAVGLAGAGAYEPALTLQANRYGNLLGGRPVGQYAVNHQVRGPGPYLDRMATGVFVHAATDQRSANAFADWPVAETLADPGGALVVHRHPQPFARVGSAAQLVVEPDPLRALERLPELDRDAVVVDRALPAPSGPAPVLTVRADAAEQLDIDVVASGPAVVVVRDALAPGWSVTVDGQPQPIALADGLFRAVAVPAGRHSLQFRYVVPGLREGAWASAGALVVVLLLLLAGRNTKPVAKRAN